MSENIPTPSGQDSPIDKELEFYGDPIPNPVPVNLCDAAIQLPCCSGVGSGISPSISATLDQVYGNLTGYVPSSRVFSYNSANGFWEAPEFYTGVDVGYYGPIYHRMKFRCNEDTGFQLGVDRPHIGSGTLNPLGFVATSSSCCPFLAIFEVDDPLCAGGYRVTLTDPWNCCGG